MVAAYTLFKIDCLFQRNKFRKALLFRCINYDTAGVWICLRLILILL